MKSKISDFVQMSSVRYEDMPASGEHEMEHNFGHKKSWGRLGIAVLKEIAKGEGVRLVNVRHNPSGSIDRGYVTGFFERNGKYVYVCIADGMNDMYFRTAEHAKDYTGGQNHNAQLSVMGFAKLGSFIQANV